MFDYRAFVYCFSLGLGLAPLLFAEKIPVEEASSVKQDTPKIEMEKQPSVTQGSIQIDGKAISYTARTGKMILKDEKGAAKASIFHVSYTRDNGKNHAERPVMFAFNGGPGSSSVWLHIGVLGPKRINFPGDGTQAMDAPARLISNEFSILDVCDLVFIDPVSTGYSRAVGDTDPKKFHGFKEDMESVGDFIRRWLTENKRWSSPKYLCGESYGGIRAAGLADHLQSRYGMNLNGVILLSSLLDFRTLMESQGSHLSYQIFLPTFATTAHFHKKVLGNRDELLLSARDYAMGEYAVALLKGNAISAEDLETASKKLSALTGISADIWSAHKLRLDPFEFRKELLREEGKVIGRFDARVAWPNTDPNLAYAEYDPSYSLAFGAFSSAMLGYLSEDLGWLEELPYEILSDAVRPWNYGSDNEIVNVSSDLTKAVRDNPKLRILVMGAYTDLATPPDSILYSLNQEIDLPRDIRNQWEFTYYEGGHMFYLNPPDLKKSREDLIQFMTQP